MSGSSKSQAGLGSHGSEAHGPAHPSPARYSRALTFLYIASMAGFVTGAIMYAAKDSAHGADASVDASDLVLIVSWAALVLAGIITARRVWRGPQH